jgi:hypothetical protein
VSNKNTSAEDFSLCDRQAFDYVSCDGLRETRSCYHTRRSATAPIEQTHRPPLGSQTAESHHYAFPPGGRPRQAAPLLTPLGFI